MNFNVDNGSVPNLAPWATPADTCTETEEFWFPKSAQKAPSLHKNIIFGTSATAAGSCLLKPLIDAKSVEFQSGPNDTALGDSSQHIDALFEQDIASTACPPRRCSNDACCENLAARWSKSLAVSDLVFLQQRNSFVI